MRDDGLLSTVQPDGRPVSHAEHLRQHGPVPLDRDVVATIAASGLRGRGGGAFPAGRKLEAVASRGHEPVVVVNGAEGEPLSGKDKALLRSVPHLVLDGASAAAVAVGSREVVIAVGAGARAERASVAAALRERRDRVRWRLAAVPDRFVAGEETALVAALDRRAAKPTSKPPYPFERGLRGAPTLVQNAETLAHLALIARRGAAWFRSCGTTNEPGSALITLSGAVTRPGIYEVALGTPVSELIARAGPGAEPAAAVLVGGYFGTWSRDLTLPLTAANGLGAGVVVAFPKGACVLHEVARVARYLAGESAGQCGPCVHGLAAIAGELERLAHGRGDRTLLARWASELPGRGACRHPDGAARFVASALQVFEGEIAAHLRHHRCGKRDRKLLPVEAAPWAA
jgi:NADH:ubiquinone oxidoreductase subunit F (NADH-binding)